MMTKYQTGHHCIDKPAYPTKGEATRAMYRLMISREFFKPTLGPYKCLYHDFHWHYGNSEQNVRK